MKFSPYVLSVAILSACNPDSQSDKLFFDKKYVCSEKVQHKKYYKCMRRYSKFCVVEENSAKLTYNQKDGNLVQISSNISHDIAKYLNIKIDDDIEDVFLSIQKNEKFINRNIVLRNNVSEVDDEFFYEQSKEIYIDDFIVCKSGNSYEFIISKRDGQLFISLDSY
jgi:hypothetical protein